METSKPKVIALLLVSVTIILWLLSKTSLAVISLDPLKSISQVSALIGVVFLGYELSLISRAGWLERLIGPLDKIYKYHRQFGIASVIAITTHASTLILGAFPNPLLAKIYIVPTIHNLPYAAGMSAFYLMVTTVFISLYIKLPYHLWKISHRILALSTLFATFHVLTIGSDLANSIPLRVWVLGILFLGVGSMLYKVFFYTILSHKSTYIIKEVEKRGSVTVLSLSPLKNRLKYKPGQFGYFRFLSSSVSNEEHPFSFASPPEEEILRIGVKNLGDFTESIAGIKKGELVEIRGGYGGFGSSIDRIDREIWIAGGIGITPFLSFTPQKETVLYYCTRNETDATFLSELRQVAAKTGSRLEVIHHQSDLLGYFNPEILKEEIAHNSSLCIRVCGPKAMMEKIKQFCSDNRHNQVYLVHEEFNLLG